jgi:hypothetical protein
MKKVILALAIVSVAFVACNEGDKKVEETKTSDTSTVVVPADTMKVVTDTTIKTTITTDTIKK